MHPLLDASALSGACTNKDDIVDDHLAEIGVPQSK
jgi:hypothetical protein